jgi:hypothetical protein
VKPTGWLLLLCVYLALWPPLNFAAEASASVGSLAMRGASGAAELTAHAAVAALSVAAGWALWIGNPSAPAVAAIAVAACAAVSVQSLYWTWLPHSTTPGDRLPLALAALAHAAAWIAYLRRSRQVRELSS